MKSALIIDDNALIREVLRQILSSLKVEQIVDAPTGRLGLQHAMQDKCDVIFLDLELPDTHGITLLKQLKASIKTPIVVITAHSTRDNLQDAIAAGASGFITKPFFGRKIAEVLSKLKKQAVSVA